MVKGGEDIRMDERVQQLFRLISGLAGRSAACVARGLAGGGAGAGGGGRAGHPAGDGAALVTYDVVPMSPRLGLMEFVQVRRQLSRGLGALGGGRGQICSRTITCARIPDPNP